MNLNFVIIFAFNICVINAMHFEIQPCREGDLKCSKQSGQEILPKMAVGIQDLGIQPSDPMKLKRVDLSSGSLKLVLKDIIVTGIKDSHITKIEYKRGPSITKLTIRGYSDINVDSNYEMSGQILILPVRGKGKSNIVLRKLQLNVDAEIEEIEKNGKKFWNVLNFTHTFDVKEKSDLIFHNMFNGNKLLGDAANELFRTNWKVLITDLGPPLMKSVLVNLVKNVNSLFSNFPLDELILS